MRSKGMGRKIIIPNEVVFESVKECISRGEVVTLMTKGQSMQPFIHGGRDSIELSAVTPPEIKVGDILLAKIMPSSQYVVHRAIRVDEECITLMGDGNIQGCEMCHPNHIIARVTAIIKPNKRVDPNSETERKLARMWRQLLPIRRYILAILRRTIF